MPMHRPANQSRSRECTYPDVHNGMLQRAINDSNSSALRSLHNTTELSSDFGNLSNSIGPEGVIHIASLGQEQPVGAHFNEWN